jgi:hypothetical protein
VKGASRRTTVDRSDRWLMSAYLARLLDKAYEDNDVTELIDAPVSGLAAGQ